MNTLNIFILQYEVTVDSTLLIDLGVYIHDDQIVFFRTLYEISLFLGFIGHLKSCI